MSLIKKPFELSVNASVKVLLYGQPGIGKTTLALSAPSPLLLDFDGGVHRVNPQHQTDTVQISSWQDCIDVLKEDLRNYKTLVIDTAGKMLDYMNVYIISNDPKMGKKDGSLALQGYGARKTMFVNFLKQVSIMGKHIIFVAHDKEEKNGDDKIIRPEIGGSSAGDLIKELDLVGYMEANGKKRTVSFDPCEKFYGKNSCGLEAIIELPDLSKSANALMTTIVDQYKRGLETRKEIGVKYNELIEQMHSIIAGIKDADGCNEFASTIGATTHIWDSKLQAGLALNAKSKELGLILSKEKKYVQATV